MKPLSFIGTVLTLTTFSFARVSGQTIQAKIDSIESLLAGKSGLQRFDLLTELAFELRSTSPEHAIRFGQMAITEANGTEIVRASKPYSFIGLAYLNLRKYREAHNNFQLALNASIAESDDVERGHAYNNLGRLYLSLGHTSLGRDYIRQSLKIFNDVDNESGIAYALRSMSIYADLVGSIDSAIYYSKRALDLRKKHNDLGAITSSLIELGILFKKNHRVTEAAEYFLQADNVALSNHDNYKRMEAMVNLAELHYLMRNYTDAEQEITYIHTVQPNIQPEIVDRGRLIHAQLSHLKGKLNSSDSVLSLIAADSMKINPAILTSAYSLMIKNLAKKKQDTSTFFNQLNRIQRKSYNKILIEEFEKRDLRADLERTKRISDELEKSGKRKDAIYVLVISILSLAVLFGAAFYLFVNSKNKQHLKHLQRETEIVNALRDSEARYRMLAENLIDLLVIFDELGTIKYASSSSKNTLGYEPDALIGIDGFSLVHPDDIPFAQGMFNQLLLTKKEFNGIHYRMVKRSGDIIYVESHANCVTHVDGSVFYFTITRDISMRRTAEEQLKLAKETAEAATRYKSEFLSSMSHEIRTPLNAVIGLTDLLIRKVPREEQLKPLQMIKTSGNNLLAIVNDILDYSKVEAGKLELEEVSFNLNNLMLEVCELYEERATSKGLAFTHNLDLPNSCVVLGDPTRLRQILSNLISNAIKFTEIGFVKINAEMITVPVSECNFRFSISDSGIGIAPENLPSIFDSYAQADTSISRKYGGTGLGLSISQRLIQLMGGNLKVESELQRGSSFYFALNLKEVKEPAFQPSQLM